MVKLEEKWENTAALSMLCVSSIAVLASAYFWKKSRVSQKISSSVEKVAAKPEKWVKVGTVKKLIIFPIKSCAGTVVERGVLTTLGLKCKNQILHSTYEIIHKNVCNLHCFEWTLIGEHANIRDRDFLVVNETGRQVTMEKFPRMALIHVSMNKDNSVTVTAPEMPPLTFTYPQPDGENERLCR